MQATHPVVGRYDDFHLDDRPLFVRVEHRVNAVLPAESVGTLRCRLKHVDVVTESGMPPQTSE